MKTAICFSGHVRNYKNTYLNFYEKILNPLKQISDVDIYISTWDLTNSKDSWSIAWKVNTLKPEKINIEELNSIYKPKKIEIQNYEEIKDRFYLKNFTDKKPKIPQLWDGEIIHWVPMVYKIFKVNELKKQTEEQDNFTYDLVIRIRFDLLFNKIIDFSSFDKNYIYCRDINHDVFFAGDSEKMNYLCNFYKNIGNVFKEYDSDMGPEVNLFYYLNKKNFLYKKNPEILISR